MRGLQKTLGLYFYKFNLKIGVNQSKKLVINSVTICWEILSRSCVCIAWLNRGNICCFICSTDQKVLGYYTSCFVLSAGRIYILELQAYCLGGSCTILTGYSTKYIYLSLYLPANMFTVAVKFNIRSSWVAHQSLRVWQNLIRYLLSRVIWVLHIKFWN